MSPMQLAPYLSSKFVDENFDFYRKYLRGATEQQPRWKRCVQYTDRDLGEALGQAYVAQGFLAGTQAKHAAKWCSASKPRWSSASSNLDWMSPATKQQALVKLHGIRNKIGYPDKWRDYSSVDIARDDFAGDVASAVAFEAQRELAKIGKPVDRGEWGMTPPTVNAYYNPQMNDINFPAGVLQPPLYDAKMDDAPNYGDTGGTIGHELTHGFDDEGSQFDANGNLQKLVDARPTAKKFDEARQMRRDQYSQLRRSSTTFTSTASSRWAKTSPTWAARFWRTSRGKHATADKDLKPVDGLTPEQRFFIGYRAMGLRQRAARRLAPARASRSAFARRNIGSTEWS